MSDLNVIVNPVSTTVIVVPKSIDTTVNVNPKSSSSVSINNYVSAVDFIYCARGGSNNSIDRYNITKETWDFSLFIEPQMELMNTGTMYAYDGIDRIYFTINATGRVMYLDVNTLKVYPYGMTPYVHGSAVLGSKMEIITTPDGLDFLYIMRHTGQEVWRSLIIC